MENNKNKAAEASMNIPSRYKASLFILIVLNIAENPRIKPMFVMLLPRRFPRIKSLLPINEDETDAANSGIEVPIATTVNPMIKSEIPIDFASEDAEVTRMSAPLIKINKEIRKIKKSNIS